MATKSHGLTYRKIDLDTVLLVLMTDSSFANTKGLKPKLVFVTLMAEDKLNANLAHSGSMRCHSATRSVMASDLHVLIVGFDQVFVIRDRLSWTLVNNI